MEINRIHEIMAVINKTDLELVTYLQGVGLLKHEMRCQTRRCRRPCRVRQKEGANSLNSAFWCAFCRRDFSILHGTFFEKMNISVRDVLLVMWFWATEVRSGCTAQSTGLRKQAVIQIYRYFRDICSWKVLQPLQADHFLFGKDIVSHMNCVQVEIRSG